MGRRLYGVENIDKMQMPNIENAGANGYFAGTTRG
jgi:hypothetical protein